MRDAQFRISICACALIFVLASVLLPIQNAEAAFGISPPFIHASNLVKGSRYSQTIYLVQDQPNEDLSVKAVFEVPSSIRDWITIDHGEEFVIPKGQRQFPVNVIIVVPKKADLAVYSGNLRFQSQPSASGQVTIALGAQVSIDITVGEGIYRKIDIPIVDPLDIEEGWNPRVRIKFKNEGNIPESFDGARLSITDQFDAVRLAYIQLSRTGYQFPETPPFTTEEYVVEFPVEFHLGLGEYWADVAFFQNESIVANEKTIFKVLPEGTLSAPSAKFFRSIKDNWVYYAGGAILVIGVFMFKRRRRRSI